MNRQRIQSIDGLRGFCLLGILIANMLHFQYNTTFKSIIQDSGGINEIAYYFTKIFIEASFYPLFSFLFGYSLIQLIESIKRRERNVYPILARRAIGLIVIGLIHHIFIWSGDILITYGITIFILLLFLYSTVKTKKMFAIIFAVLAVLITATNYSLGESGSVLAITEKTAEILQNGTYIEVLKNRLLFSMPESSLPYFINIINFIISSLIALIAVMPFALVGMIAAQKGYLTSNESSQQYKKDWIVFILSGLILKSCILLDTFLGSLLFAIGGYLLTFGYIKLFVKLYESVFQSKLLKFFSSLGRMSLSNYLVQSIICTSIFYGYAIGLFGKVGVAGGIVIAIIIYVIQGIVSYWYLTKFQQGPVEIILRLWTYLGNKQKVKLPSKHQHHI